MSNALKTAFGAENVATEDAGYLALPDTNFYPGGAPPYGIALMQLLHSVAAQCQNSKIVGSGYRHLKSLSPCI
ncbi:hypothetical protein BJ170DRAFT_637994 [Xylariales sp. AK1849]|nr:hypothetical protein BJ170DRAFT_637994 [Xylariales sp. AK1849]